MHPVRVDEPTHKRLRLLSALLGKSQSAIAAEAVEQYSAENRTKVLDAMRDASATMRLDEAVLDRLG